MTPLRERMIEDMQRRNFSDETQRSYTHYIAEFARHFNISPDQLVKFRFVSSPPFRQDGEGPLARPADSPPYPDRCVTVIVALTESPSVADDRIVTADWTAPRQAVQGDHPGVNVVFRLWQCDKKNHRWREGPPVTVLCQSSRSAGRAFTLR